jgi:hypothetical protein
MPVRHMYPLLAPEAVLSCQAALTTWLLYTASPNQVPLLGPPIASDVQAQFYIAGARVQVQLVHYSLRSATMRSVFSRCCVDVSPLKEQKRGGGARAPRAAAVPPPSPPPPPPPPHPRRKMDAQTLSSTDL